MTVPLKSDLRKREERIAKWAKLLDSTGHMPDNKLMQMLRAAVRQVWMHNPVKLLKLETAVYPDMDVNTRTKWLVKCECCHGTFKKGDVQVDHIHGGHSLKTIDDLLDFFNSILNVTAEELQVLCKPCHELKTYMEAHPEMTREEAVLEKKVLAWLKKHPLVSRQKFALRKLGYDGDAVSNPVKRRASIREMFCELYKKETL
ncbi:MAG: HNH endonuclease signature motif containing protein [Dehalococcoidales bacterium]